ncbi:glycerol-3-phosphate dehydrogenase/oxidase [Blastococcus mobilis]|uniref:Glycerol-3-phosphate dehydrogenase n=1 Tax=Blastococcus mobilis TaxID=1938746 RepID=A0A238YS78_9ACTN|nr:glycerol-3-phosphate dehydrogenase/oxidase [Blastococcus mobilis]SNR74116.1 glycerol-3-phosphate dehydrogenase [Blastococcus mobilis]
MPPGETDRARLSPERRRVDRARLADEVVDVLVIGGGVTGAGAALDAASRGLSVGLLEARDWAAGTSSRSSTLIHGGLRPLEQFAVPLVHEALSERSRLIRTIAPHLVHPLPFLLPLTARIWQRAWFGAALGLYDALGAASIAGRGAGGRATGGRGMPWHRHLSRKQALAAFPGLRGDVVRGGIQYWDAQVDDARHTLAVVRTAAGYGARALSSARVTGLLRDGGGPDSAVVGARVADLTDGSSFAVRARSVVAATGVWSDDVGAMLGESAPTPTVRAAKGVHLVVPRSAIGGPVLEGAAGSPSGLVLRTPAGVLFVIPWDEHWIIGTTDTPWRRDRDHPAASSADIAHLLDHVNRVLIRPLGTDDVLGVYAGLRPLPAGEFDHTSRLSRQRAVVTPVPGLVLVAGGEYTTYRVLAEDAVDAAVAGLPGVPPSRTAHLPLVGAHRWDDVRDRAAELSAGSGVPGEAVVRLLRRHGDRIGDVLALARSDPALARPLPGAPGYLAAEVVHAVTAEGALHLDDVLARRTRVSIETAHRGVESAPEVARLMASALGWDGERTAREVQHYTARVAAEREAQRLPDDHTADAARLGAPEVRARV